MNKATKVREIKLDRQGNRQFLWRMDPPMLGNNYVITSGLEAAFDTGRPETYIFASDKSGEIIECGELEGSFQGSVDHEKALAGAGYETVE